MAQMRDDVTTELLRAYERVKTGGGQLVFISGDSGIGKTYAVNTFIKSIATEACIILSSKARPQTTTPFYPIYEGLEDYLRQQAGEPRIENLISHYHFALPGLRALSDTFPNDESFVRREWDLFRFQGSAYHFQFSALLKELAGQKILVFFIDDLQWVDRDTMGLITYLSDHIGESKFLIILAANLRHKTALNRDEMDTLIFYLRKVRENPCVFFELRPVATVNLQALIENILGASVNLTDEALQFLAKKTQGVPLIIKTFLNFIVAIGVLKREGSAYILTKSLVDIPLPESLREDIQRRLRSAYRLLPESRSLLELASVIGERFNETELEEILNLCDAYRILAMIEENQLLVRELLANRLWEFEHIIVRDFIYENLGGNASQLHLRIAEHLVGNGSNDFQRIAYHYEHGGAQREAMEAMLRYGEMLLRTGNFREARHILDGLWARPLFTTLPAYLRSPLEAELNHVLCSFYLADYDVCLQMLARVTHSLSGAATDPRVILLRCRCQNKSSSSADFEEARLALEGLLNYSAVKQDQLLSARIFAELVVSYSHLSSFDEARHAFESARKLMQIDPLEHARLMRKVIIIYEPELALPILEHALATLKEYNVAHEIVMVQNNIACCNIMLHNFVAADLILDEAISAAIRLGNFRLDYLLSNRGAVRLGKGDARGAAEDLNEAARFARRRVNLLCINNNQAAGLIIEGHLEEASALLRRAREEAFLVKEDVYIAYLSFNLSLAYILSGNYRSALLTLAAVNIKRLAKVSGFYARRRRILSCICLELLGANASYAKRQTDSHSPDVITMEFWGD